VRKVSDRTITYLAMTGLIVTLCAQTVRSPAEELVKFDSVPYLRGQIQQRQARERGETPANAPDATIDGYLSRANAALESRNCDGAPETDVTSCSSVAKAVSTAMST
jgi:hypothetical protein